MLLSGAVVVALVHVTAILRDCLGGVSRRECTRHPRGEDREANREDRDEYGASGLHDHRIRSAVLSHTTARRGKIRTSKRR